MSRSECVQLTASRAPLLAPVLALALLVGVAPVAQGELVDIAPYYGLILEKHNDLRRAVTPPAADMREMMWDEGLARQAEEWSRYCRYQRPPKHMYPHCGANIAYQRRWVHSWHSIRGNVRRNLNAWAREEDYFQYGTDCGSACSYVQMVYSSAYRVGCAMNKCGQLAVGRRRREKHATLFVCFYAPKSKLIGTYPYRSGSTCRECPLGTKCSQDLCVEESPQAVILPETPAPKVPALPSNIDPGMMSTDALTDQEAYFLTTVHNSLRREAGCAPLAWDMTLQKWADWIVSCRADYPGPPHSYTNFYRCTDHMPVYEMVYAWGREGADTGLQLDKGCRTPYDHTHCNHNTNMLQSSLTSMACSACNCGDGMRQVVCLYDNQIQRRYRGYK